MKKSLTIMLSIILLVTVFFSYDFVIRNAHHDCSGEECQICIQMEAAVQFVSNIKFISILSFFGIALCVFTHTITPIQKIFGVTNTLVKMKVEFLN